ncbi:hypothetical protein BpHYR1_037667 [Brachionus plicatilis]|uniref:Uncharacterized protein n=1 Tax=Brachionus plicatilis TaxID=10195 RepID=A0A3M7P5V1_BRAPC|nr:hypothetical protein BpHYR1_037667 [Brachionus plicatilis]
MAFEFFPLSCGLMLPTRPDAYYSQCSGRIKFQEFYASRTSHSANRAYALAVDSPRLSQCFLPCKK